MPRPARCAVPARSSPRSATTWPFYSYRRSTETKHSELLNRTFHSQILMLSNDLKGSSEVGGLFLHPGERAGGLGMLLARSRYLFIAAHRARFADRSSPSCAG
jgi:arginine N-succinyltransferase